MRAVKAERMRGTMVLLGVLLLIVGVIWILQGIGTLKGSFMTGSAFWGWMGGGLAVAIGAPILVLGLRRR